MPAPLKSARLLLRDEIERPDEDINLARAALLIALEEYPMMSVGRYLGTLDLLAVEVEDRLAGEQAPIVVLDQLVRHLFERDLFRGNRDAYYDPRNSYLNDVLDRGLGIPLTLGMVLLEVGWRLGLPLDGVNFPGHFLVRYRGSAVSILVDTFNGGERFFEDEAQSLLDRVYGGMVPMQPAFVKTAGRRDMLVRMLTNLKGLYSRVKDQRRSLAAIERILVIRPTARSEVRDRGLTLARMGRFREAAENLEAYLAHHREAVDAQRIEDLVVRLKRSRPPEVI